MRDPMSTDDEHELANRLKREARAMRPAFSDRLHNRIRDAMLRDQPEIQRRPPTAGWRPLVGSMVVAATVLLSASLVVWWLSRPSTVGPELAETPSESQMDDEAPDLAVVADATEETVEQLGQLVEATLTNPQWAYLDHDVQLAARLFMEQFPSMEMLE